MTMRIKLCGITRVVDAQAAAEYGADAIGLVFYPPSPRYVTMAQAAEIVASLPPFVSAIGLFVDPDQATIDQTVRTVKLDALQLHGSESPAFCHQQILPVIKSIRVRSGTNLLELYRQYRDLRTVLLDHYVPQYGGMGQSFDWANTPRPEQPFILAGGLNAGNVAQAINLLQPAAVDVSTGVELDKGIKSPHKISQFIRAVRQRTQK